MRVWNPARAAERVSPCSTFKIPHALIALELGVLDGPDHVLPWDGTVRDRELLNRDHDLASAIRHSVVWYFQEVATRIGPERMQTALDALGYGNRDISGGQTTFWLGGSLRLSAEEQAVFLARLARDELPFGDAAQDAVLDALVVHEEPGLVVRGKTGSRRNPDLGWWVGWVCRPQGDVVFVGCARGRGMFGHTLRPRVEEVLRAEGVLPRS